MHTGSTSILPSCVLCLVLSECRRLRQLSCDLLARRRAVAGVNSVSTTWNFQSNKKLITTKLTNTSSKIHTPGPKDLKFPSTFYFQATASWKNTSKHVIISAPDYISNVSLCVSMILNLLTIFVGVDCITGHDSRWEKTILCLVAVGRQLWHRLCLLRISHRSSIIDRIQTDLHTWYYTLSLFVADFISA